MAELVQAAEVGPSVKTYVSVTALISEAVAAGSSPALATTVNGSESADNMSRYHSGEVFYKIQHHECPKENLTV
jgi:hypothetical protein